jgi:hypothetical protein
MRARVGWVVLGMCLAMVACGPQDKRGRDADEESGDDDDDDDDDDDNVRKGLEGKVYEIDLAEAQWLEPAGVSDLLVSQFGEMQVWASLTSVEADTVVGIVAQTVDGQQDRCTPTVELPPADWQDSTFEVDDAALTVVMDGLSLDIEQASAEGTFSQDGSRVEDGRLSGYLETTNLGAALGLEGGSEAICDLIETFGVVCLSCPDSNGDCIRVDLREIEAPLLEGVELEVITEQDIAASAECYGPSRPL